MEVKFDYNNDSINLVSSSLYRMNEEMISNISFAYVINHENVFLVTNDDDVYCLGRNGNGQLGLGFEDDDYVTQLTYNEYLSEKKIVKFYNCTYNSTIFCFINGFVYGWGRNRDGEVGDGTRNMILIPKLIGDGSITFKDIKSGFRTTIGLTRDGHGYIWGSNRNGEIYENNRGMIFKPIIILYLEKIESIHCTDKSSYAVHEDGRVFGWGDNSCGQLCSGHFFNIPAGLMEEEDYFNIVLIEDLYSFKIKKISCGRGHVLVLDKDGHLYSWGLNDDGQLGDGSRENRNKVFKINVQSKVTDVLAGRWRSVFKTEENDVYVFGLYNNKNILVPTKVERRFEEIIKEVVCLEGITYRWTSAREDEEDGDEKKEEKEEQNVHPLSVSYIN